MTTSGPNYAGTATNYNDGATTAWTDVSNAAGSNSSTYAYNAGGAIDDFQILRLSNFGFSIPNGATINGITVEIYNESLASVDNWSTIKLLIGGIESGNNLSDITTLNNPVGIKTFGSSTELWGLTPSYSDINSSGFGISLKIGNAGDTVRIYWARITINYTGGSVPTVSSVLDNTKYEMRVNGPNLNLGYLEYENTANEDYGLYQQYLSISGFPTGDFSLFVNTDAYGAIHTNDFNIYRSSDTSIRLQFYDNSGSYIYSSIDLSDYNSNTYLQYKGCLLTYRNSIFNYYYLDSDGFRLCYTSPTIARQTTGDILYIDGDRNYQYEQMYSLNRIGIANSGISSSQITQLEDWMINVLGQLPTTVNNSYTANDFHAIYRFPTTVSGLAGRLNGMIGDIAYVSGDHSLYSVPSDSTLYMEAVVEYTGNNPSGIFLSPSITKNNNNYTNVWTPNSLRIFPSSGIHKVRFSDDYSDTSPYPMHPTQFEFRTYSENCASGYRGGQINIYAMNFYFDHAYCVAPVTITENMLLSISGAQTSNDTLDLSVFGGLTSSSGLDLFLKTTELSSASSTNLFIEGGPYNKNIPLYLGADSGPQKSGTLNLFIYSTTNSGASISVPLYLGSEGYPGSIPLYIAGDQSGLASGYVPLYLDGGGNIAANVELFIQASPGSSGQVNLSIYGDGFSEGWMPINNGCNLYLERSGYGVENSIPLYLCANSGINNEILMSITGGTYTTNSVDIYISGIGMENENLKLYTHGI